VSTPPDPGVLAADAPAIGAVSKVRFRFRKGGPLRWVSHHDLMRTFERVLRRADIPFRRTQGFNPHPRLVFALSLPLGVVGCAEVGELELDEPVPSDELLDRLRRQCPPGLEILDLCQIPVRATARVCGLCYAIELPAGRVDETRRRIEELLQAGECWIDRRRPSGGANSRRLDLRPFLRDLRLVGEPAWLHMDLRLTAAGTARPEEVLGLLQLKDVIESGGVLHRLRLDLEDDASPGAPATA
jgi:radical SAM-linked protein